MKLNQIDYKGKYFFLQDMDYELDTMDFIIGTIDKASLTDDFLKAHVEQCRYYGIPAYIGSNKELRKRIELAETEYEKMSYYYEPEFKKNHPN